MGEVFVELTLAGTGTSYDAAGWQGEAAAA